MRALLSQLGRAMPAGLILRGVAVVVVVVAVVMVDVRWGVAVPLMMLVGGAVEGVRKLGDVVYMDDKRERMKVSI